MYTPRANRVDDDAAFELVARSGFGQLVSGGVSGLQATGLPLLLDREARTLRGHFARVNDHWSDLDGTDVLVLFQLADGYVSPGWYPSKAEDSRVVPTWNYEVVHVHGRATIHDDAGWVRRLVTDLTERHESQRGDLETRPEWAVTDAPDDFIERQLRAIVGVEIAIERIAGKRKLSQNRSDDDRQGVIDAHGADTSATSRALSGAMIATDGWSDREEPVSANVPLRRDD